jgi:hypothetical protein
MLAVLAPDIVDEILRGSTDQALVLEQLERPLPASWAEQHMLLCVSAPLQGSIY